MLIKMVISMIMTPVEVEIYVNNYVTNELTGNYYLLEPGIYYIGRADTEFDRDINDRFGNYNVHPEYKYAIYLFKKDDLGLKLIDIISKGNYRYLISRYQFRLDVNPNGDDYSNAILRIGDYGQPKKDVLCPNGGKFKEERLKFNNYLELLSTTDDGTARIKFGLVGVVDIIGPNGYTKKDEVLEYKIRTYNKGIIKDKNLQEGMIINHIDHLIIDIVDDSGQRLSINDKNVVDLFNSDTEPLSETTIEVEVNKNLKYFQLVVKGVFNGKVIDFGKSQKIMHFEKIDYIKEMDKIYSTGLKNFIEKINRYGYK